MSTEAIGDGKPDAVDAAGPDVRAEAAEAGEAPEAGEAAESAGATESDEGDEGDEPGEDYKEYADDEAPEFGEDDEALEYDEDFEGDKPGETAEPRRARRWPRVLLAFGFVILAAAIVGGAIAIVGSLTHGFKKPVKVTYKTSAVFSLKAGDCFDPQGQQSYTLIPCDSPHQAEVFATFALTGTKWPGDTAVQAEAGRACASRLTGYVNPQLAISLSSTYVYPDSVAWQAGTRTVICEARAASGELTGSVRGASASTDPVSFGAG
jgi:Septum formation